MVRDALHRSQVYAGCARYGAALLTMRPGEFRVPDTGVLTQLAQNRPLDLVKTIG